uniref:Coiled-coil domain-containing protein 93 n=1 Tax=Caenorhabditis tropicalis TaxID=1561998 RepID=A0A1I7V0X0_9PELO
MCRNDIITMLSASGYHRARVAKLSDYDKIIGGMAWAISRCDDDALTVDILYEESEDQNIKLRTEQSEKLIRALQTIGCPHQISAHQILGLDYVSLKNVIQWLIRRVLNPLNENRFENFIDWFSMDHQNHEWDKGGTAEYWRRLRTTSGRHRTPRQMKRFDPSIMFDLTMDAKCTLAEYVLYARSGDEEDGEEGEERQEIDPEAKENLQELTSKKHVPTSTIREMMEEVTVEDVFQNDDSSTKKSRDQICNLIDEFNVPARLAMLENRLINEACGFQFVKQKNEELKEIHRRLVTEDGSAADREELKKVFETFKETDRRAAQLRDHVISDLKRAQEEEDRLRRNVDEHGNIQKYCIHKREIMERYAEKTAEIGKSVKETITLQCRLDRIMGQALSGFYRKRNMERLHESVELTREAKMVYDDYNVTIDILTFSAKINGFINEIEKTLTAQPATQEYREAFVAYMNDVRNQLAEYHWKAKLTQEKRNKERMEMAETRVRIRDTEREVVFLNGEMEKVLKINEILQKTREELAAIESKVPV